MTVAAAKRLAVAAKVMGNLQAPEQLVLVSEGGEAMESDGELPGGPTQIVVAHGPPQPHARDSFTLTSGGHF